MHGGYESFIHSDRFELFRLRTEIRMLRVPKVIRKERMWRSLRAKEGIIKGFKIDQGPKRTATRDTRPKVGGQGEEKLH